MTDPFHISGPATISFSGGRTSAFLLYRIIKAHGGSLPEDIQVVFANTGKERPETLTFVQECAARWGVKIVWVEWRDNAEGFEIVGPNSCSREGEPFLALILKKKRLPNWTERWCTGFLKVAAMHSYLRSIGMEIGSFAEVIGLRADEGHRILRGEARAKIDGRSVIYPLGDAGIRKADVMAFWREQPFDLQLEPWEGNCDVCFLKGRGIKKRIIRDYPELPTWWDAIERELGQWFDRRDTIAQLIEEVRRSPELFDAADFEPEFDAECGDVCGGDTPEDTRILQKLYEERRVHA